MLCPTSFGIGKKSPGAASMMLIGGFRKETFNFGLQKITRCTTNQTLRWWNGSSLP